MDRKLTALAAIVLGFVALSNYNYGYGSSFNMVSVPSYQAIVSYPSYSSVHVSSGFSPVFLAPSPSYSSFSYGGFSGTRFYDSRMHFRYIDP